MCRILIHISAENIQEIFHNQTLIICKHDVFQIWRRSLPLELLRVTSLSVCTTKTESPDFKVKVLNTASKKSKLHFFKYYSFILAVRYR